MSSKAALNTHRPDLRAGSTRTIRASVTICNCRPPSGPFNSSISSSTGVSNSKGCEASKRTPLELMSFVWMPVPFSSGWPAILRRQRGSFRGKRGYKRRSSVNRTALLRASEPARALLRPLVVPVPSRADGSLAEPLRRGRGRRVAGGLAAASSLSLLGCLTAHIDLSPWTCDTSGAVTRTMRQTNRRVNRA